MTDSATPTYGAKADPNDVSYEPHGYRRDGGNVTIEPPYYYLISNPDQRVVWVQPPSETGISPAGWFALYTGAPEDYEAVVPEAA
jgi:hypothetical protein